MLQDFAPCLAVNGTHVCICVQSLLVAQFGVERMSCEWMLVGWPYCSVAVSMVCALMANHVLRPVVYLVPWNQAIMSFGPSVCSTGDALHLESDVPVIRGSAQQCCHACLVNACHHAQTR